MLDECVSYQDSYKQGKGPLNVTSCNQNFHSGFYLESRHRKLCVFVRLRRRVGA